MKKILVVVTIALVLSLVFTGCPNDTPKPNTFVDYTSKTASISMKAIEGGTFARDNNGQSSGTETTDITVSNFYLGETEVTQGQWEAVMGTWLGGDLLSPKGDGKNYGDGENYPAYYISFYDAVEFCIELSKDEGLTPYYTINKEVGSDTNNKNSEEVDEFRWLVTINSAANGYRLPTEAEWEYAAGGGATNRTEYAGTNNGTEVGEDALSNFAWYEENNGVDENSADYGFKEVGTTKNANTLGLYDMSGNSWEWCWDWALNPDYDNTITENPIGFDEGTRRASRGGGWWGPAYMCQVDYRAPTNPSSRTRGDGFRVARSY